ncbi:hypothetical protein protein [Bacillus cereus G9241]|nr:hypothetical protein protein [Bacillus cereus G9241]
MFYKNLLNVPVLHYGTDVIPYEVNERLIAMVYFQLNEVVALLFLAL